MSDPNVIGGFIEGFLGICGGVTVASVGWAVMFNRKRGNGTVHDERLVEAVGEAVKTAIEANGKRTYCDQHSVFVKDLTEVRTNVAWLVEEWKNGGPKAHRK